MSGLLGFMAAGAAKGFSEGQSKAVAARQEFDLKTALLEAQTEKEMMLQERGIKLKEDAEQRSRDKVTGLIGTVKDPMEGKGGYEAPEDKEKRTVDIARQKANVLRENGYIEEAKSFDTIVDQYNKGELSKAKLENEITKINNALTLGREKLESQGAINEAKNATQLAKIEAAAAKGGQKSDADKAYDSYVEQVKADGKKPMARYQFDNWMENKKNQSKGEGVVEETKRYNQDGTETKVTKKIKPGAKPEQKVFTYDPKARSLF